MPSYSPDFRSVITGILAERDRWLPTVEFDADRRWYRRIDADHLTAGHEVEAWVLSWLPGQDTGLHDHGGASGAFAVAVGVLRERSVHRTRLLTTNRRAGQVRVFGEHHVHDVVNVGSEPAVSVHVYSPTITRMTRYRWTRRGAVVTTVERAGADW